MQRGSVSGPFPVYCSFESSSRVWQALIDGPTITRQAIAYKKVVLTPYVLKKLPRGARTPTVNKVWKASEIDAKWESSAWNKKRQIRETRKSLTDFDRFKVQALKTQRRKLVAKGQSE